MSSAVQRLASIASQIVPSFGGEYRHQHHIHQLSPTFFLPRAAEIEPDVWTTIFMSIRSGILIYIGSGDIPYDRQQEDPAEKLPRSCR